jgi:hypothetical protein
MYIVTSVHFILTSPLRGSVTPSKIVAQKIYVERKNTGNCLLFLLIYDILKFLPSSEADKKLKRWSRRVSTMCDCKWVIRLEGGRRRGSRIE